MVCVLSILVVVEEKIAAMSTRF